MGGASRVQGTHRIVAGDEQRKEIFLYLLIFHYSLTNIHMLTIKDDITIYKVQRKGQVQSQVRLYCKGTCDLGFKGRFNSSWSDGARKVRVGSSVGVLCHRILSTPKY